VSQITYFLNEWGKKYKAKYAVPIGGEFVVDVDSFMRKRWHHHSWHPQYTVC
jgi:hypothetical protein